MSESDLSVKTCSPCEGGTEPLNPLQIGELLPQIPGWTQLADGGISRRFTFSNYYQTMAFVNAVAWLAHGEDHHPDLQVGYDHCTVAYITHAIGGLSENDFICAAKVNRLIQH